MDGLLELCETTKNKLDRDLKDREIDFLKWLYEKYLYESKQSEYIK